MSLNTCFTISFTSHIHYLWEWKCQLYLRSLIGKLNIQILSPEARSLLSSVCSCFLSPTKSLCFSWCNAALWLWRTHFDQININQGSVSVVFTHDWVSPSYFNLFLQFHQSISSNIDPVFYQQSWFFGYISWLIKILLTFDLHWFSRLIYIPFWSKLRS